MTLAHLERGSSLASGPLLNFATLLCFAPGSLYLLSLGLSGMVRLEDKIKIYCSFPPLFYS